jgi:hypothetical protein
MSRALSIAAPAAAEPGKAEAAGRMCPADYAHSPRSLDRPADIVADTLYVVGGLYGNLPALDAVERLAAAEAGPVSIVVNGDFHWFDAEPAWFAEVERRVARHVATRGNIETEIARADDIGAGCGCAYPEFVGDDLVARSNDILGQLREVALASPDAVRRLASLAMTQVARVGALAVGIVHGDAAALAGWRFSHQALDDAVNRPWIEAMARAACVDVFASTHTCLAALRDYRFAERRLTIVNNGAAGMPNFAGSHFGLLSRISVTPSPHRPAYGFVRDGVHIDALPIAYDTEAFLRQFLGRWPEGTAAHASYFGRLVAGPAHNLAQAWRGESSAG